MLLVQEQERVGQKEREVATYCRKDKPGADRVSTAVDKTRGKEE